MKPVIFKPKKIQTNINLDDYPEFKPSPARRILDKMIDRFFQQLLKIEMKAIDEEMCGEKDETP